MIFRIFLIVTTLLIISCSDNSQVSKQRAEAQDYYRTTNTIIAPNNEIITFPPVQKADHSRATPTVSYTHLTLPTI